MNNLDYGLIGNCTINALIDRDANIVWSCFPRFDGDPVFSRLLDNDAERGYFGIEMEGTVEREQSYIRNTAILRTVFRNDRGSGIEIVDFCPRFEQFDRMFRPTMIVRMVCPLGEAPRIRVRLAPHFNYGGTKPDVTRGSNHLRFVDDTQSLRLTTDAPLTYITDGDAFRLDSPIVLMLGPDESLRGALRDTAREFLEKTTAYWQHLSGRLHVPFEWQDAVIRSAITLKLCQHEETGAIVAALTTSIPEHADSGRNWDYRYCWIRDAYYTVQALNRLGALDVLEGYLEYLRNIVDTAKGGHIQPLYGVGGEAALVERIETGLTGYRGMGPVRVGNQAYEQIQHDAYGQIVLSNVQAFFDNRLFRVAGVEDFQHLEMIGERAWAAHDQPDAGLWELRTRSHVHTYSAAMCWAACDRLANAAELLKLEEREVFWRERAAKIRANIEKAAWREDTQRLSATFGGDDLDASLIQLLEMKFVTPDDPRFLGTLKAVEEGLRRGSHMLRYATEDDFGLPETAF
ncbi:MAG: glycoside hydrolase family 15 protein, partial [Geminicoccaceae bacterium]|nr:glycoside hydrolase family 15 protein [Geminicoccaceae bacterium]